MSGGDANGQNAKWAPWRHAMKMRSCCGDGTHTHLQLMRRWRPLLLGDTQHKMMKIGKESTERTHQQQ